VNIIKSLIYSIQEGDVVMPPVADEQLVADCVKIVSALVKKCRQEEEAHQECLSGRLEDDGVRYKTEASREDKEFIDSIRCNVPKADRIPPSLNARELSFSARLLKYVQERCDGKAPVAYKRAGIDRKLYSKIVSDNRSQVSKQTALQFVIGLQLNRREADEFLKAAGYSLSPTIPLDCVFEYCIEHLILNIVDVNAILVRAGLPSLNLSL